MEKVYAGFSESLNKLQHWIFYWLILLLPANLAKHWPQSWSYVNGILVDYLIPTVYLTDLLIGILLLCWLIDSLVNNFQFFRQRRTSPGLAIFNFQSIFKNSIIRNLLLFIVIIIFIIFNFHYAVNLYAALYKLIKIIEFTLLIWWIKKHISIKNDINSITNVLSLTIIWQSVLAILQWFKQGAIFGYYFYGEQPYTVANLGIKFVNYFGALKIPPYGTFPHPNVLAGFLTISLTFILIFTYQKKTKLKNNLFAYYFLLIALILGTIALFLTFSYPAWLVWLCVMGYWLWERIHSRPLSKCFLLFILCFMLIAFCFMLKYGESTSFSRRSQLNMIAINMWLSSPLTGVGLNNFIPRMEEFGQIVGSTRFLQPVHNIFLLVLTETGIIGVFSILYLVFRVINKKRPKPESGNWQLVAGNWLLAAIIFLGLFDHYWLTLQQGNLVLALVLGLLI